MALVATLVVFVLLLLGIAKKANLNLLLVLLTFAMLVYLTVTGGSVLGENGSGSALVDCFTYIVNSLTSNIGNTVFTVILVSAYVEVMSSIRATDKLVEILSRPIGALRSKHLVIALVFVIAVLLRTCITAGPAEIILLLATFFPLMLRAGCSLESSAAVLLISNAISWGPADPVDVAAAGLAGVTVVPAEWFVTVMVPVVAATVIVAVIVFLVTTKVFDGKLATIKKVDEEASGKVDAPAFYAILPFLPLILMLVFSPFAVSFIAMSINTACLISLGVVMLVVAIVKLAAGKKPAEAQAEVAEAGSDAAVAGAAEGITVTGVLQSFSQAFGSTLAGLGLTIMFAIMFATTLNSIGGMQIIASALVSLPIPPIMLVLVVCIFAGILNAVVGSFLGALSIMQPIGALVAAATGVSAPLMVFLIVVACGAGCVCSPVNPMVLILSEKVPTGELVKRVAPAIWIGLIAGVVVGCLFVG